MDTSREIELVDLDGTYVRLVPDTEVLGRVIDSNTFLKGQRLGNESGLTWAQAKEDKGGYTLLSPWDLVPLAASALLAAEGEALQAIEEKEEIRSRTAPAEEEALELIPDPVSLRSGEEEGALPAPCESQAVRRRPMRQAG